MLSFVPSWWFSRDETFLKFRDKKTDLMCSDFDSRVSEKLSMYIALVFIFGFFFCKSDDLKLEEGLLFGGIPSCCESVVRVATSSSWPAHSPRPDTPRPATCPQSDPPPRHPRTSAGPAQQTCSSLNRPQKNIYTFLVPRRSVAPRNLFISNLWPWTHSWCWWMWQRRLPLLQHQRPFFSFLDLNNKLKFLNLFAFSINRHRINQKAILGRNVAEINDAPPPESI